MKVFWQAVVLGSALVSLAGCGGGGGSGSTGGGNTNSSSSSSSSVPMTELSIQGLVTDGNAIANADVTVTLGSNKFTAKADAAGKYTVAIKVPQADAGQLVQLVAKGTGAQAEAEFISMLPSLNTLVQQAGGDKLLDSSENLGVNITQLTTAAYGIVLGVTKGLPPTTEVQLQLGYLYGDSDYLAQSAGVLKLIVDRADFVLPQGFNSMLALVADGGAIDDYLEAAVHLDSALVSTAIHSAEGNSQLIKPANSNLSVLAGITDAKLAACLNATGETALANVLVLNCADKSVGALTGLANLTNLQGLNIRGGSLSDKNLDLAANTKLKILVADDNDLISVNLVANTSLEYLALTSNLLGVLDISKNTALTHLYISDNQLFSLNLQPNTQLEEIVAGLNHLDALDVTKLPKLKVLWLYGNDQLTNLNLTNNPLLEVLGVRGVSLSNVDLSNKSKMKTLLLADVALPSLDLGKMTDLRGLYLIGLDLTSLNLSNNKKLDTLTLTSSYIDKLDLSQQTELISLTAHYNEFTSIDLSKNTKLTSLNLDDSGLVSISGLEMIADKEVDISLSDNNFSAATISYLFNLQDNLGYTNLSF